MKDHKKIQYNLFRADLYRILALGLDTPTSKTLGELKEIVNDLWKEFLPLKEFASVLSKVSVDEVAQESLRLFSTKVACPSCEGSYQLVERGPILGDVTAFYKAFQLQFLTNEGPPDSIKMELAFLSYMALKEAFALEEGLLEEAQTTFEAQKKFLLDHLGRWGEIFANRLQERTTHGYYKTLGSLLKIWLKKEFDFFNIQPFPLPISLPQLSEEEVQCSL
ncbi:MAG: hypothetical protein A2W61_06620 [Deltaproteobacteria bacterium RIFCSPLOWO2_01_44_7]|nr:MAG: hypothetical protein A2712_01215 [Deltaproteobacteria bacterium RIFCSPHIGHO2_01_FULL_43_49]OGQ15245.1 MAG: hypothetical protein A3D22_04260 [Deltaproteobacteria bacterium RIFCSPHIGHO2_02_FULL_44_53]OGQ27132.1 MAG: hypothetical protein A3D98_01805 [Deltaproteobacteria bacterium RIFCSPHIGHO2_12_FULL_44_21]OGQ31761.1 MAG: hypothetical protein A2979_05420 [Deltaproteobacteria bacterium RIFCSPLOWO2_01_FULL_45_74]OGQ42150.1 MAG: hypothetical protein A2W61_06620 [Deltaproteobacteria bacterium 